MTFTVGRVAKLSGLSVRSLHHYDEIGLLVPSHRSEAGYRLYSHEDVQRLYRIQALRQFGWSLTQIQQALDGDELPLVELLKRQIAGLDREISEATALRARLTNLHDQLFRQQNLTPEALLGAVELFGHYDKHLSQDELKRLSLIPQEDKDEWRSAYADAVGAVARGVAPVDAEAQAIAQRWIKLTWRQVGGDLSMALKLKAAYRDDPGVRSSMNTIAGIDPSVLQFIWASIHALKVAAFAKHFSAAEMALMDFSDECAMERARILAELREAWLRKANPNDRDVLVSIDQLNSTIDDFVSHHADLRMKLEVVAQDDPKLRTTMYESDALYEFIRAAQAARTKLAETGQ